MLQSKEAGASPLPKLSIFFCTSLRVSKRIDLPFFECSISRGQGGSEIPSQLLMD